MTMLCLFRWLNRTVRACRTVLGFVGHAWTIITFTANVLKQGGAGAFGSYADEGVLLLDVQ